METLSNSITLLIPLLGVALGAGLHYLFTRSAENRKHLAALRTQAYVDYLRAVSKFAQAAKTNPKESDKFLAEAADAKTRICIHGSKEAIRLLANFERTGAFLGSEDAIATFVSLCSQMRSEAASPDQFVEPENLEIVMFGNWRQNSGL